jgi:hypothetical protein
MSWQLHVAIHEAAEAQTDRQGNTLVEHTSLIFSLLFPKPPPRREVPNFKPRHSNSCAATPIADPIEDSADVITKMAAISLLVADRVPVLASVTSVPGVDDLWDWMAAQWRIFMEWASQPCMSFPPSFSTSLTPSPTDILAVFFAYIFTCGLICTIILGLGFGPVGVAPRTFTSTRPAIPAAILPPCTAFD